MNTQTHLNGCHNRAPFKESMRVQDGLTDLRLPYAQVQRFVEKPFRMATDCQYTKTDLGKADKGCDGCKWRDGK